MTLRLQRSRCDRSPPCIYEGSGAFWLRETRDPAPDRAQSFRHCRFARRIKVKSACAMATPARSSWWARVTDVAKCRRQGLVVCRAALPFEGSCDARPGVALAPALLA